MPAPSTRMVRKPRPIAFVVRAVDTEGFWTTIGYAWERKNNEVGYSVKLNALPIGEWDGNLVLIPPLENDEPPNDPETGDIR